MNECRIHRTVCWFFQLVAAAILLHTLYFNFRGAEESVDIFTKLGMEPWGRFGSGVLELMAAVLSLSGRWSTYGAAMAVGIMAGAIASNLKRLGVVVNDDGGLRFALAWTVFLAGAVVLWLRRSELPWIGHRFKPTTCVLADRTESQILENTPPFSRGVDWQSPV